MESSTGLAQLPGEIVDIICANLERQDVTSVRLTCRSLQAKSDRQWVISYFGQTPFVLTRESLTLLIKLSKNQRFAPCIRELQLVLVILSPYKVSKISNDPFPEIGEARDGNAEEENSRKRIKRHRRTIYQKNMHDQNLLRKRGIDISMLTGALRNLRIESFSILDKYSTTRPPWGVRKLYDGTGLWPETAYCGNRYGWYSDEHSAVRKSHWEFSVHALAVAMGAILRAGQRLKDSLTIQAAPYTLPLPRNPVHRRLAPASTPGRTFATSQIPDLDPAFAEVKEIAISTYGYDRQDLDLQGHRAPLSWFADFLPLVPAVKIFKLTGIRQNVEPYFFGTLLAHPGVLPGLRELHLEKLMLDTNALIKFLHNHSEVLEFFGATGCSPQFGATYLPILQEMRKLQAMRSIKLVGQTQWAFRSRAYMEERNLLEGMTLKVLEIDQARSESFQAQLAEILRQETGIPRR